MKSIIFILCLSLLTGWLNAQLPDGNELLGKIDKNLLAGTMKTKTSLSIQSKSATRTLTSENWFKGSGKAFTEYTQPVREAGTKMLKDGDNLWIYDTATDRVSQLSGNQLRQSLMGSDLSYEDFLEMPGLAQNYDAVVTGEKTFDGKACWVVELTALNSRLAYQKITMYVDKQVNLPVYEERRNKTGKLLKTVHTLQTAQASGRWYPKKQMFKDETTESKGTIFTIEKIEFDVSIPSHIFSKASLKQ